MTLQETLASIAKSGLPLQGKLDALRLEFDTNLAPPAAVEALHRATSELIASGAQNRALKAGDIAPDFTLPDPDGHPVSSKVLLAKGPLVVTFSRRLVSILQFRFERAGTSPPGDRVARCEPGRDIATDSAQ
jgi:hypothetical protein